MAVYVDDMGLQATVQNGDHKVTGKWSHLFADTHEELMTVAEKAGLNPRWIQHPGTPDEHFDVTGNKVPAVVKAGAQPVSWRFTGQYFAERHDRPRTPEKAQERCDDIGCTDHPGDDPDADRPAPQARKSHRWPQRERGECRAHDQCLDCWTWTSDARPGKPCEPRGAPEAEQDGQSANAAPRPPEGRVRHAWGEVRSGVRSCQREDCAMVAEQRWNPAAGRPLVIYSRNGQRIVSDRVPPCGSELPGGDLSAGERRHLAEAAGRQAGEAYKAGDLDRAFRLLTDARCLDPGLPGLDGHERQLAARAQQRQPGRAQPAKQREAGAGPQVIQAGQQQWAHWNAGLPRGLCGPEWQNCPEHGTKAASARMQDAGARQREGAA
jgi:hypothetical protein